MADIDNLKGGTKRVVEETEPLNNLRGGTKRVVIVGGGGSGGVSSVNGQTGDVTLTIPDAVQYSTMPTASADNLGKIVQFTGTTDANYTNGYFYKCVSDGQDPATYSWSQVSVQPAPSGLPDQTGQSGKFLTTDGTDASWSDKPLVNMARTAEYGGIVIGQTSEVNTSGIVIGRQATGTTYGGQIVIGQRSGATNAWGVAIGYNAHSTAEGAIQLSGAGNGYASAATNSESYTLKVCLGTDTDGSRNYKLLDSDGTIPEARLADTTNAQQGNVLTLDSTGNAVWQAGGGGGSSYTAGTGIDITNNAINVQMPVHYNENGAYAIGIATQEPGISDYCSVAIGTLASAGSYGVNIGGDGPVPQGTVSIGWFESTPSEQGVVLFHTMDSNYNYHTYKMLEADGTVPADRLASTANLADGNYRLRCTITNGVPTLSWVAE